VQAGYHLWNAAPYVLTLAIMLASTSKARASIGAPGELSMTR
jgi:simple sugar transport system permease protein